MVPIEEDAGRELQLLEELRMPGEWNEKNRTGTQASSWTSFKEDVDTERVLFKIIALYVADKLQQKESRTLDDYLEAPEGRDFEAGLDIATLIFDAAVTAPVVAIIGVPGLAVGFSLVGLRYGYRLATDNTRDRVGDKYS